jgi:hypothetical protein
MMSLLKWSHDVPRDSSSSCLKFRTTFQRLTTLEMGKKCKQNFEHKVSQSPYIFPTVRSYHCLAIPVKENGNNFYLKVLSDMPAIRKHAQVCSNSCRCEYGFSLPSPEKGKSQIIFIRHECNSQPGVRIGSIDFGGLRLALVGAPYRWIGVEFIMEKKKKEWRSKKIKEYDTRLS